MAAMGTLPAEISGNDAAIVRKKLMTLTKENQVLCEEITALEKQLSMPVAEKKRKTRKLFSVRSKLS
jgi:hypothetical protein